MHHSLRQEEKISELMRGLLAFLPAMLLLCHEAQSYVTSIERSISNNPLNL
jgi:hypothetical protein